MSLTTVGGVHIGEVLANDDTALGLDDRQRTLDLLELVEIAKGCSATSPNGEIYHVMWIERKGEIAYRKCVGWVRADAWDAQDPESINLTLG